MASCSPPAPPATATAAATPYFPPELLREVARRLTSLQDFFALRASCRAYRAALPLTASNLASQAPLLLLVPGRERERERDQQAAESPALYHLPLRRLLRFRLPHSRHQSSSFFSLGCRVFICDYQTDDPSRSELRMVHLLTGEQTRLPTPAGSPSRFVLSGDDLLLAWSYYCSTIQSHRLGGGADGWSLASIWKYYALEAMVSVDGTIYVLLSSYFFDSPVYHVAAVELSDDRNSAELVFLGALDPRALELPVDAELCLDLAECRGELVLVAVAEYDPRVYRVFKWSSVEDEWVRITSLGGCALFFGCGYFVGCLGPHHPGIRDDCLYFNDKGLWSEFSFVDGAFRRSDDAVYPRGSWASSVWVFPSMC
jgi:hypothetical protein